MAQEKQVVVITGSSGRIGTRIIERIQQNYQSVGLDFVGVTSKVPSFEFIYVDLGSDESVHQAFERIRHVYGNRIASIVHLAAYYSFDKADLDNYERITVQGTARLLKEAKNFEVDQFIFTSTMLVHEPTERGVIQNEDSPIVGKWPYPASKVRTEHLIKEQHGNIPYVILRIGGCYDERCNCVPLSQHISRIYEKKLESYPFPGDTGHGVPYTHFDDLVDLVVLLIDKRKEIPQELTLLVVEEDSITYRDLQTSFGMLLYGKKWPMFRIPKFIAKIGAVGLGLMPFGPKSFIKPWMIDLADDNYEFTMDRAKKILGWSPKRSLRKTIPKMIEDLKADPIAWYKRHKIPVSKAVMKKAREEKGHGSCNCS